MGVDTNELHVRSADDGVQRSPPDVAGSPLDQAQRPVGRFWHGVPSCPACESAILNAEMILVGRTRTTSSPGTALRWPNSLARCAPMYRPPIRVAISSRSSAPSCTDASFFAALRPCHERVGRMRVVDTADDT